MPISQLIPDGNRPPGSSDPRPLPRGVPRRLQMATQIVIVRLRFLLALLAILLLVGYWDTVRTYWDAITRRPADSATPVSLDTEFWCPMCPGVLADWPGKCPVCNMALVRRKKGEAVPLPDGVVARMQLSPYRMQLGGIATSTIEYRPLIHRIPLAGLVEKESLRGKARVFVQTELFEKDLAWVVEDASVEARCDAHPGRVFQGRIASLARQIAPDTRSLKVRLAIDDPNDELLPGMLVTASVQTSFARSKSCQHAWIEACRDRTTVELLGQALFASAGIPACSGAATLIRLAGERLLLERGLVLAVPESAVVDTGARKVVYREYMPGTFDGVEVMLGRRSGEYYPVLRGLEFGDRVVTAGALLIDAETRLNPSIAASYFGAERGSGAQAAVDKAGPSRTDDKELIERQKVCPVTGEPLGSMGSPVRVTVAGKTVFLCCQACEPALKKNPEKYLAKLKGQ
jgi:membrane fusion protein, copper/silver efflux system